MDKFNVVVAGGREFTNLQVMTQVCDYVLQELYRAQTPMAVVSGTARGADRTGEQYAASRNIPVIKMPADWDRHGKRAGYLRNSDMADVGNCLIAFWDGTSKGTKHMIDLAFKKGINVYVANYQGQFYDNASLL